MSVRNAKRELTNAVNEAERNKRQTVTVATRSVKELLGALSDAENEFRIALRKLTERG